MPVCVRLWLLSPLICFTTFSCKTAQRSQTKGTEDPLAVASTAGASAIRDLSKFECSSKLVKVAFFDADSTVRVSKSGAPAANSSSDVLVLPFVAAKIAALNKDHYLVAIVSNQGGVGINISTPGGGHYILSADEVAGGLLEAAAKISKVALLQNFEAHIDYIDMADHNDAFRKPASGMAQMLADMLAGRLKEEYKTRLSDGTFKVHPSCAEAKIDWAGSFMIGDAGYKVASATGATSDPVPEFISILPGDNSDLIAPYPRQADDFTNSDRLFAENLQISENGEAPKATHLAYQEPADFFGWWSFRVGNLLPDAAKANEKILQNVTLTDFLKKLEQEFIPALQTSAPQRAAAIKREVDAVRQTNGQ